MSPSIRHRANILRSSAWKHASVPTALLAAALCGAAALTAQTAPATTASTPAPHHRAHAATKKPSAATPAAVVPPAPAPPDWPINDHPVHAAVTWDSRQLRINATNSSLQQILADVASATGAKFEGVNQDQRVFGNYGPGQARDVLSELLQGSGYNFLLIGDEGQGVPREVVLSSRRTGNEPAPAARPAQDEPEDDIVDTPPVEQQPPPNPQPIRPGFGPDGNPRTPQQIQQEMLLRQQQMQQQQQQQAQPNNPPN